MSLLGQGTAEIDTNEITILTFPEGGVFVPYVNAFALQAGQSLEVRAYSKVNQNSEIQLYTSTVISGPAPVDPSIFDLGEVVSSEYFELTGQLVSGTVSIPWRVESVGRVSTVPDGEGKQTAVVGTEHALVTVPYGGTFMLIVDVSEMDTGDTLKLRLKARAEDGGTILTTKYATLSGAQGNGITTLGPIVVRDSVLATLHQSAGVARSFHWNLVRLG